MRHLVYLKIIYIVSRPLLYVYNSSNFNIYNRIKYSLNLTLGKHFILLDFVCFKITRNNSSKEIVTDLGGLHMYIVHAIYRCNMQAYHSFKTICFAGWLAGGGGGGGKSICKLVEKL